MGDESLCTKCGKEPRARGQRWGKACRAQAKRAARHAARGERSSGEQGTGERGSVPTASAPTRQTEPPLPALHGGSKYSREIADRVCALMAEGVTLRKACERIEVLPSTVRWWVIDDVDGFAARYALARRALTEHWADETLEISDDGLNDTYVDDEGKKRIDHDHINRSRLRVDTRKWLLSKLRPEQYGDKLDTKPTQVAVAIYAMGVSDPRRDPLADQPLSLPARTILPAVAASLTRSPSEEPRPDDAEDVLDVTVEPPKK